MNAKKTGSVNVQLLVQMAGRHPGIPFTPLVKPDVAAATLGVTPAELKKSRRFGLLQGRAAPPYYQLSPRIVRYSPLELAEWKAVGEKR